MEGGRLIISSYHSVVSVGNFYLGLTATEKEILNIQFINRATFYSSEKNHKYNTNLFFGVKEQLDEYFKRKRKKFDIPIKAEGTNFQMLVWQKTSDVDYGEVVTYSDLAKTIGNSNKARGVGNALHKNPIPIIIPCHRIIRKDGNLGGYNPDIETKRYLLDLER